MGYWFRYFLLSFAMFMLVASANQDEPVPMILGLSLATVLMYLAIVKISNEEKNHEMEAN